MVDRGVALGTTVHDAIFLEALAAEIEEHVCIAQERFAEAGMEIVGYPMPSDAYIFSGRFEDDDGEAGWNTMLDFLGRAERESIERRLT
jgi:hypothetical protein